MSKKDVLSIEDKLTEKWVRDGLKKMDRDNLFEIDMSQVYRHPISKALNGDPKDRVSYGTGAEAQLRRMLDYFGFERLPATVAEFKETYSYCRTMYDMTMGPRDGPFFESAKRNGLAIIAEHKPVYLRAYQAFFDGDFEALRRVHTEQDMMSYLATEYREVFPRPPRPA